MSETQQVNLVATRLCRYLQIGGTKFKKCDFSKDIRGNNIQAFYRHNYPHNYYNFRQLNIQLIIQTQITRLYTTRFDDYKTYWEMLMNVLRVLINNPFKESFYKKRKKTINVLTLFFIFHKNEVKTFLKWIFN